MAAKNRNADSGRRDPQRGFVENLARLIHHFQLFFGITAVYKGVDVGNAVESDLVRKLLHLSSCPL